MRCSTVKSKSMTFQPVSTSGSTSLTRAQNAIQRRALIDAATGKIRHAAIAAVDDENFVDPRGIQGDREQSVSLGIRLDVEGEYARLDIDAERPQSRVRIHAGNALRRHPVTLDFASPLDAAIDQIADGEAHIGLEGLDAGRVQTVTHSRNVLRSLHLDARYAAARETAFAGRPRLRRTKLARAPGIGGANIKVGTLPVIAYQKRIAALQPTVEVHDRDALPMGCGDNAITRLQNQTTCRGHTLKKRAPGLPAAPKASAASIRTGEREAQCVPRWRRPSVRPPASSVSGRRLP